LLVEIKAPLAGHKLKRDLQQVLSYALLDWSDAYAIRRIGILQARRGALIERDLEEALAVCGGGTVAETRDRLHTALLL
jgi:hypothetical protein